MFDYIWTIELDASPDSLFTCSYFFLCLGDGYGTFKISWLIVRGWVHIFSEGSHSTDEGKIIAPAKRGIARLENYFPLIMSFFLKNTR